MWHHHWKASGCPHVGEIADQHRLSRARYHRAVRKVIRDSDMLRMESMGAALCDNRYRDLWKEVKKLKGKTNLCANIVDGLSGEEGIAKVFSVKYNGLYNSVPYESYEIKEICEDIDKKLRVEGVEKKITVNHVKEAISKLKSGKSGGDEGMYSDHVINGTNSLVVWLTCLFNCMLVHGVCPSSMSWGTMVPIPKDKRKSLACSDNYRAITLSSIIGKVFDWVILFLEKII